MTWPRDALRVRRYLDGLLIDTRELSRTTDPMGALGPADAEWSMMATEAGARWAIVIDDPAGDWPGLLVLEGNPGDAP